MIYLIFWVEKYTMDEEMLIEKWKNVGLKN